MQSRCSGVPSRPARAGSADSLLGSAVLLSRDGGSLPRPASAGTAAHDGRMRSSAGVLTIIVIIVNLASMLPPHHGPHGPKMPPMTNQFKTPQGDPRTYRPRGTPGNRKVKRHEHISTRRSVLRHGRLYAYIYTYICVCVRKSIRSKPIILKHVRRERPEPIRIYLNLLNGLFVWGAQKQTSSFERNKFL